MTTTSTAASRILTVPEAAKLLRLSRSHLSNLLNGKVPDTPNLPCLRVGRRVLFRRETLESWLEKVETIR